MPANTQAIKRRIGSVKNTKQITKAMELVAASKLRRAQAASARSRAYRNSAREILARLGQLTHAEGHPLFTTRQVIRNHLYLVFTSDRGLAGAYNNNVQKLLLTKLHQDKAKAINSKAVVVGRKGAQFIAKLQDVELRAVFDDWPTYPNSRDVRVLYQTALEQFQTKQADIVTMVYTDFKTTVEQVAVAETLLPLSFIEVTAGVEVGHDINEASFEPSPNAVLDQVVPRLAEIQLLQAALEASASEQSMRMLAMKSASDNASDLIDDLTLEFNSARQAAITQELAEITGGAAAIE